MTEIARPEPLLAAVGVRKSFGGVQALRGVDVRIDRGEICGIVGPNGSGKTTFFHCVSGYHRVTSGRIIWAGRDITRLPARRRARLGLVRTFQQSEVFSSLDVEDNVRVALRSAREKPRTADPIGDLLEMFGLADAVGVVAGELPFGKRRLLGLAIAVALDPVVLLLDEPTSGLSESESTVLQERLLELRAGGLTMAIVDHHMDFLLPLCDRVVLLRSGENLWEGLPEQFATSEQVLDAYLGTSSSIAPGAEPGT